MDINLRTAAERLIANNDGQIREAEAFIKGDLEHLERQVAKIRKYLEEHEDGIPSLAFVRSAFHSLEAHYNERTRALQDRTELIDLKAALEAERTKDIQDRKGGGR